MPRCEANRLLRAARAGRQAGRQHSASRGGRSWRPLVTHLPALGAARKAPRAAPGPRPMPPTAAGRMGLEFTRGRAGGIANRRWPQRRARGGRSSRPPTAPTRTTRRQASRQAGRYAGKQQASSVARGAPSAPPGHASVRLRSSVNSATSGARRSSHNHLSQPDVAGRGGRPDHLLCKAGRVSGK